MRKLAILGLALIPCSLAVAPSLNAQSFGVEGGFVSSNWSLDPTPTGASYSSKTGFAGGVSVYGKMGKDLMIGAEPMYIMKGTKAISGTDEADFKVAYIEVPVLFRYTMQGSGKAHFFLTAGPQVSFKASCKVSEAGVSADCNTLFSDSEGPKSSDFGLMFGAGVAYEKLSGSIRYDLGLTNDNNDTSTGATKIKNKALLIMVGYSLGK